MASHWMVLCFPVKNVSILARTNNSPPERVGQRKHVFAYHHFNSGSENNCIQCQAACLPYLQVKGILLGQAPDHSLGLGGAESKSFYANIPPKKQVGKRASSRRPRHPIESSATEARSDSGAFHPICCREALLQYIRGMTTQTALVPRPHRRQTGLSCGFPESKDSVNFAIRPPEMPETTLGQGPQRPTTSGWTWGRQCVSTSSRYLRIHLSHNQNPLY